MFSITVLQKLYWKEIGLFYTENEERVFKTMIFSDYHLIILNNLFMLKYV